MELKLCRYAHGSDSTGGILFVDGKFNCFTLEDEARDVKVPGETRIPCGKYEIKLRNAGGMTKRYAERFDFHDGMLWLQDVTGFELIYIHVGNTDDDTEGCILVGDGAHCKDGEMTVSGSVNAYTRLYPLVAEEIRSGVSVSIEVVDL